MCRIPSTGENYPFQIARIKDTFIVKESRWKVGKQISLTNAMDYVIEHIILGTTPQEHHTMKIFQYGDDGLFEVTWFLKRKITRDMPPWAVSDVKWTYVSKDLSTFEVLYGKT